MSLHVNRRRFLNWLITFVLLLYLAGCSATREVSEVEHAQSLETFPENWNIMGRISMVHGNENWYARFNWIQQGQDFEISFTGPLGETELQISQLDGIMRLQTPSVQKTTDNLEQLVQQETGWHLPLDSLRYWSRGQADPSTQSQLNYDDRHQISEIHQSGWRIQYLKRMPVEDYLLPRKIHVTNQELKIKILVNQWLLANQAHPILKSLISR